MRDILKKNLLAEANLLVEDSPRVYVGTYAKYNNGSLGGEWLDLSDYSDHDEFMDAATDLHSDESDPELMFQDIENFKGLKSFYSESRIDPEYWDFLEETSHWDDDMYSVYTQWTDDGNGDSVDSFDEAYQGEYGSMESFAESMVDDGVFTPDSNHIYMSDTDRRLSAQDLTNYLDDYDESDIVSQSDYDDLDDYMENNDIDDRDEALDSLREEVRESEYDRIYDALDDPYNYFVEEQGLYSPEDFFNANFARIDYESVARELGYDYVEIDGHIFRNI